MPRCSKCSLAIGEVARRIGVSVETIRYYERLGLLARPVRSANGYRAYTTEDLNALIFIKRARRFGFSLSSIRELLRLRDNKGHCSQVRVIAAAHRSNIREQIDGLRELERELEALLVRCESDTGSNCPVIEALER